MIINVNSIKIQDRFKRSKPSPEKIKTHLKYYIENNKFMKPIILDENSTLVDGYITYLIAKLFSYKKIDVLTIKEIIDTINNLGKTLKGILNSIGQGFIEMGNSLYKD